MPPITKKTQADILKYYFTLGFPGSFQSIKKFHSALKDDAGIQIGLPALRKLMRKNLYYDSNIKKPKKFPTRKVYSQGVGKLISTPAFRGMTIVQACFFYFRHRMFGRCGLYLHHA